MRKLTTVGLVVAAALALSAVFASTALALPTFSSQCSGCHSGTNVPVTATLASNSGSNATYNVSAPGAYALAVFRGSTKMTVINAASGQFTVATGSTYTVFAVKGPSTNSGIGSTSVSPVAPPVDATPPVTTSDAKTAYALSASIKLTATDAGSGVAHTYYKLDGGLQTEGTVVTTSALGAHTLEFWSVDAAGNVETHKNAAFTVDAVLIDLVAPVTVSDAKTSYVSAATVKLTAVDALSGVAHTYYRLDGGPQTEGSSIAVATLGTHTVQFWSVDVSGNVEAPTTVTFAITAPPVVRTAAWVSTPIAPLTMYRTKYYTVYGMTKPRHTAGTYPVRIYKYRLVSGTWKSYGYVLAKASNYSTYSKYSRSIRLPYAGKWRLRAYHPQDATHLAAWSSGYDYVTVK